MLDITSASRGLLIPRVALTSATDGGTITNPATSLLVYNTSGAIAGPGFYFNSGTSSAPNWERFVSSAAPVGLDFWRTTGNAGTNPSSSFLGTTDAQDLAFRVGNTERMRLRQDGTLNLLNALTVGGPASLFSAIVANGLTVGSTLGVSGATTLAGLSAGATTVNGTLNVSGVPTFGALGGTGNRLVVADGSGNLSTQAIPAPGDAILNQNTVDQIANFRITGSGRLNGALSVGSTLGVTGATTLSSTLGVTGNTSLSTVGTSGLATLNTARVTSLVGAGNRVVITDANGNLITGAAASIGTGEFIQNQTAVAQPANFRISGSGEVGDGFKVFGKTVLTGDLKVAGRNSVTNLYATIVGNPSEKTYLQVNGEATITDLVGTGTRLVVADATGKLGTQTVAASDYSILNQNAADQIANFRINGTGRIGSTLNVAGATTLAGLTAGTTSLGSTSIGTLGVTGGTTLAGLTAGAATLNSASVTNVLSTGTLNSSGLATLNSARVTTLGGSGNRLVVTDDLGNLTTQAIPAPGDAILNQSAITQPANFKISGLGQVGTTFGVGTDLTVGNTLTVAGASTLKSVGVTNNATVGGTLAVTGNTTLSGANTFNSATVTNDLTVTGNAGLKTLSTSGLASLSAVRIGTFVGGSSNRMVIANSTGDLLAVDLPGSSGEFIKNTNTAAAPAFAVSNGLINANLTVGGTSALGVLSAGATTLASANVTNAVSAGSLGVTGTTTLNNSLVVAGPTQLSSLGINQGTRLVVTDGLGNLSTQAIPATIDPILNQVSTQNASFNLSGSGELNSLRVNGNTSMGGSNTVGGALVVMGTSTLSTVTVNSNATVAGALGVGGTTTMNDLNTSGLASLASARVANLKTAGMVVNDANGVLTTQPLPTPINAILNQTGNTQTANFQISGSGALGTLTVSGVSTLAGLNAGATTLSSATVAGSLSAGTTTLNSAAVAGPLSVDGATTLKSSLDVSAATKLSGLTAGSTTLAMAQVTNLGGTGTRLVVADGSGNLGTQDFPSPGVAVLNQSSTAQAANFNINGSGQIGTTLSVGTAMSVGATLGVGSNASVGGALNVTGTTTLGNALTVTGNIVPNSDGNNTLGTSALRWANVYSTNGTIQTSDARLKTNIMGLGYGMSTVMAMRPVRYAWKKTPSQTNKIGFIAQELQKVVPEVVSVGTDANQTMGVNYAELVPVLVKALQEQQAQLDTMRGRAEKAEAAVQTFESRLRALEAGTPVNATAQGQR
ncbi:tail fiber domain-containing protein [Hymenobacter sedentarius]|uniref:tail fiber domain-containing protein n=1 Tax=Hymenobacter sedentarius TaxID=1411621 RepID=UPI0012FDB423|nr:tail fiber domain-containing protein [Hymenobacter sedentarius]